MSELFSFLYKFRLRINLIQKSTIGMTLCIEDKWDTFNQFKTEMEDKYAIGFVEKVDLYTIRHGNTKDIHKIEQRGEVLLKQMSKETVQVIILQ